MTNLRFIRVFLALCLVVLSFLFVAIRVSVVAAPLMQVPINSPTPGPDGRIIYIVQPNDTLTRIALIFGVSEDELRGLNNLSGDTIIAGQQLLIGLGGPAEDTPTPGPSPTPTMALPTPSPEPGFGNLCILLFDDQNGDAIRQEEEPSLPAGAISVSDRLGNISLTAETTGGLDPHCFEDLAEAEYTITVAIPEGYNPTTETSYVIFLYAGDETYLDFGAQANSDTLVEAPTPSGEGKSPILGIIGVTILLTGIGVAIFAGRLMKN